MRLLAIDGNSIMNRAYYGIKLLSNSKGVYTNALTGFMNIYLKEVDAVKPDHVAVAFDLRAPTFRHKADAAYKANRKGMPEELAQQMPQIKELLTELGITVVTCEGYEADDILGTLSRIAEREGGECFIVTGDRDSYQLVTDKTTVRLAATKETKIYTPERIKEEYGVEPLQMIEIKALMGDSSDNIPGVKGIGEKTAVSLIQQAGSVEGLYEQLDEMTLTPSVRKKLSEGRQSAENSRFLATICLTAPIDNDIETYALHEGDKAAAAARLTGLEMFRLMEKLGLHAGDAAAVDESNAAEPAVLTEYEIKPLDDEYIASLDESRTVVFELAGKQDLTELRAAEGSVIYTCDSLLGGTERILAFLTSGCKKLTFDAKAAYKLAFENGESAKNIIFSCDLAGYLLNSQAKEYTVENLCAAYSVKYRSDMEGYESIASLPALCEGLSARLDGNDLRKLFDGIEMPLCEVLASMETVGVKADRDGIKAFGESLRGDIERLKQEIYDYAGEEFNILSPKQLGEILFSPDKLGLKGGRKTKTGYSTSAEVLEALIDAHPMIPLILEYRTLTKLMSTYVEGLLKVIAPDGRIHSYFKQTETRTGRISSTEPNLQNIPVRKEIGRNMRRFFVAEEGMTLVDADYSQIELRVLASVCGDENMQRAFLDGIDIHTMTAASVFGLPEDFVTPEMRSAAKAVNFGIIYGIGAFSLSKDIGVSVAEAKQYIENYLENFPKISQYMDSTVEFAKDKGYVLTIFDRRRYIPELKMSNKNMQAFGKRVAMNAPIQGSAADIIKIAMINVYKRLKKDLPGARLILQIHDELIIECDKADADKASALLKEEMEGAVRLAVPLTVDVHTGASWFEAKE
ncbi:DNA polymerase I [Ruminococcus sp. NK3A76]|uniref:DNA polymerase I n=1 Tax=Ruminococcus sp. NK3A76 TaxID=877411 RepID=UPI00048BDBC1|nr:DNA polymerase I [Ruminococcus sp. NK3A76]